MRRVRRSPGLRAGVSRAAGMKCHTLGGGAHGHSHQLRGRSLVSGRPQDSALSEGCGGPAAWPSLGLGWWHLRLVAPQQPCSDTVPFTGGRDEGLEVF